MKLYTIGYSKKSAAAFFSILRKASVKRLVDVRLHNTSQLAGYTKKDDLSFFAEAICKVPYQHVTELAPTEELFEILKKGKAPWEQGAPAFLKLLKARKVERHLNPKEMDGACLLCSEAKPHHCHRRLVAEYLQDKWPNVEIIHL